MVTHSPVRFFQRRLRYLSFKREPIWGGMLPDRSLFQRLMYCRFEKQEKLRLPSSPLILHSTNSMWYQPNCNDLKYCEKSCPSTSRCWVKLMFLFSDAASWTIKRVRAAHVNTMTALQVLEKAHAMFKIVSSNLGSS